MTAASDIKKPKKSWLKLVLFTFLCLFLSTLVIGWMLFGHYAVLFYWNDQLNKALAVYKSSSEQGKPKIEAVFKAANDAKVAPDILMRMYRVYGMALYMQDEIDSGDEQIEKAIQLGKNEPATNYAVADQLTHAYQDRGWEHHYKWMNNRKAPDGAKDQEMSVKVAETSFGADHEQTISKIPSLAVINADLGNFSKADALIERCVKSVETQESSKGAAPFVYAMLARVRAVEHRYKDAIEAYFKCREVSPTDEQSNRGWDELMWGLKFGKEQKNPLMKQAGVLLNKGNFAELDRLAAKFIADKSETWNGYWNIDYLIVPLEFGCNVKETQYDQLRLDLGNWLAKNPHSLIARSALANLHIFRAWAIRDEDDGNKFNSLIEEAKKTMAAEPGLQDKIPNSYIPALRLTVASNDKAALLKTIQSGNKRWPTYFKLDLWAADFLSQDWLGDPGEQQKYVNNKADTIGGAQGDKFYARFAWHYFENHEAYKLFGKRGGFSWDRVEKGFRQIFKEFPDEKEARIAFLRLALFAGKENDARRAFDDKAPAAK